MLERHYFISEEKLMNEFVSWLRLREVLVKIVRSPSWVEPDKVTLPTVLHKSVT